MVVNIAPDIKKSIIDILTYLPFSHIREENIYAFRSKGSKSKARARIWAFPRIWQKALNREPCYIIEVISEAYDHLSTDEKKKILIHELLHIPKNFSGSLRPHKANKWNLNQRLVESYFQIYKKSKKNI